MRFWDQKFTKNKARYLLQCLMAAVAVFILLVILDARRNTAVIAALGASSFITFTMPNARVSKPRFLIGGYLIGILSGVLSHHVSLLPFLADAAILSHLSSAIFGALAVGLAIFLMVVANVEHPPAASVALGLVLNNCDPRTILVVLGGIVCLSLIKRLIRPLLMDLL